LSATNRSVLDEPDATDCRALADILARVGDKWTVMVVGALSQGPMRYNAIRRLISGISQRMLTLTLRGLERDGLISRTVYPTVPAQVEYALTDMGRTLTAPLDTLLEWARAYRTYIAVARESFDKTEAKA
jgi:DNA-binding HxlR family transcriptional regulator